MQTETCPPPERLKAYLSGKLDAEASDVLTQHLLECASCELSATEFELEPDTLVELLQDALPAASGNHVPTVQSIPPEGHDTSSCFSNGLPNELGQYELLSRLGSRGMGAVYLARHKSLDKPVAVKLLPALPARNAEFVARFQREMRAAGKLDHPAIVRTTDAGEQLGIHFLVMDVIDGMNLSSIVRAEEKLSVADACEVVRQAAVGLAHAHEKGIVHRDVKPSNLMLDTCGQVRILDFGLAQVGFWDSGSAEITTVGQLMGTLDYMAPEQAERGGAVDYRADLYSLGATLFRLLTGRAPLAAAPNLTPLEKLRLLATHRPPKLGSLRPDVPEEVCQVVDCLLARDPAGRPASAIHAAELLGPYGAAADLVDGGGAFVEVTSFRQCRRLEPARRFERHSRGRCEVPHGLDFLVSPGGLPGHALRGPGVCNRNQQGAAGDRLGGGCSSQDIGSGRPGGTYTGRRTAN